LLVSFSFQHVFVIGNQVTLSPGDMLYLPPFWFHRVRAETTSISVNVWSDSKEGDLRLKLVQAPLPFEEDWSYEQKVIALKLYITTFSQLFDHEIKKTNDPNHDEDEKSFIHLMIERQYMPMYKNIPIMEDRFSNICKKCDAVNDGGNLCHDMKSEFGEMFNKYAVGLVEMIEDSGVSDNGIKEEAASAFVETMIYYFLGAENIHRFLRECFF